MDALALAEERSNAVWAAVRAGDTLSARALLPSLRLAVCDAERCPFYPRLLSLHASLIAAVSRLEGDGRAVEAAEDVSSAWRGGARWSSVRARLEQGVASAVSDLAGAPDASEAAWRVVLLCAFAEVSGGARRGDERLVRAGEALVKAAAMPGAPAFAAGRAALVRSAAGGEPCAEAEGLPAAALERGYAMLLQRPPRTDEAARALAACAKAGYRPAEAEVLRGCAALMAGDREEAARRLRAASASADPGTAVAAAFNLGLALAALGRGEAAAGVLAAARGAALAAGLAPLAARCAAEAARCEWAAGRAGAAAALYEAALRDQREAAGGAALGLPASLPAELVTALVDAGRSGRARELARECLAAGGAAEGMLALAAAGALFGDSCEDLAEGLDALNGALLRWVRARAPKRARRAETEEPSAEAAALYNNRALTELCLGREAAAARSLQMAVLRAPPGGGADEPAFNLAALLLRSGDWAGAAAVWLPGRRGLDLLRSSAADGDRALSEALRAAGAGPAAPASHTPGSLDDRQRALLDVALLRRWTAAKADETLARALRRALNEVSDE